MAAHFASLQGETGLTELLSRCETLAWDVYLDASSLQLAAESYCHSCDPTCVMADRTSSKAAVLRSE